VEELRKTDEENFNQIKGKVDALLGACWMRIGREEAIGW